MTATVQAKNVGAGFGDRELFSGVDLVVAPGDVVGLVGPNGAGKSTLLQILGGRRPADAGSVAVSPAHAQLGYLAQEIERLDGESVRDHLGRRTGVTDAQTALNQAADGRPTAAASRCRPRTRSWATWRRRSSVSTASPCATTSGVGPA